MENGKWSCSAAWASRAGGAAGGSGSRRGLFGRRTGWFAQGGRIENDFSDALQGKVKCGTDSAAAGQCAVLALQAGDVHNAAIDEPEARGAMALLRLSSKRD